jgi:hypothetical protein
MPNSPYRPLPSQSRSDMNRRPHRTTHATCNHAHVRAMTKTWGRYGTGPGEFNLPHSIAVDREGHVYVADRENQRIQIFDADGTFLKEWTGIGYPYGLFITPDQNVWMIDGGYDRIVEIDQGGRIMGAFGEPGHAPGQFAWGHFLAIGKDRTIYVADVLNWRFQVLAPTQPSGKAARYVPPKRMLWDRVESTGWSTRTAVPKDRTPRDPSLPLPTR